MAGIPSFFKQYGPKGLNIIPRYYDPDKEKREERLKRIKAEMGIDDDGKEGNEEYVPRIQKGTMTNYFHQKQRKVKKYTFIRLIVIALILFLIAYVFIFL